MIKAVVFDCFGVIIADALEQAVAEVYAGDQAVATELRDLIAATNHGLIDTSEARPRIAAMLGMTTEEYTARIVAGNIKDQALLAYIRDLRRTYKTGMLSNIGKGSLLQRFDAGELAATFDAVVASADIGYAKPEPQAYQTIADRLGVQPAECLFTDDRPEYCVGAHAVGMQAVQYRSFVQFKADADRILLQIID